LVVFGLSFDGEAQVNEKTEVTSKEDNALNNVQRAAAIFFEHGDFIHKVIHYKIRDENKVEDLFQDFFLSLVTRPIPQDVRNIRSFLYKAIINDVTDRTRSIQRYKKLKHKYADIFSESVNNKTTNDALLKTEQIEKMIELISKRATKSEASAINLRYRENLCIDEVADRMHINKRSVSRYISAGLRKVRRVLSLEQGDL
jgi:RNA polymerase sigma factor (sigma-70 family)